MGDREAITQKELDSFLGKLNSWGDSLDPAERGLLQVVLARAASGEGAETEGFAVSSGQFGDAAGAVLRPLVGGGPTSLRKGVVSEGDPWVQGS